MFSRRFLIIFMTLLLSILLSPFCFSTPNLGNGFLLSVAGNYHTTVSSEFDSSTLTLENDQTSGQLIIDVPELSRKGYGFSGRLGFKAEQWGAEFQYTQNRLDKLASILTESNQQLIMTFYDINAKYYFIQKSSFKSYFIFGFGYSTLLGNQMKQLSDLTLTSSEYIGLCYNLGVGINYFVNTTVFLFSDYIYRGLSYTTIEDNQLDNALSHPLHSFYIGVGYAFGGH